MGKYIQIGKKVFGNIRIITKPYTGRKDIDEIKHGMSGGFFELWKDDKKIGQVDLILHHKDLTYPFGDFYPKNSALIATIELDEVYRGKGYGSKLLKYVEDHSRSKGMTKMYITSVENEKFFIDRGYHHTGTHRVWVKDL